MRAEILNTELCVPDLLNFLNLLQANMVHTVVHHERPECFVTVCDCCPQGSMLTVRDELFRECLPNKSHDSVCVCVCRGGGGSCRTRRHTVLFLEFYFLLFVCVCVRGVFSSSSRNHLCHVDELIGSAREVIER